MNYFMDKLGYIPPKPKRVLVLSNKLRKQLQEKKLEDGDGVVWFEVVDVRSNNFGKRKAILGGKNYPFTVEELLRRHTHLNGDRMYPTRFVTVKWVYPTQAKRMERKAQDEKIWGR